jgi:hypothetical protein
MGSMIGVPFFLWLLLTAFDFGNIDQLFAFFGIIGLAVCIATFNSPRKIKVFVLDTICFILLASPIVRRLTAIPIENFNYLTFIIPTSIFVLFYILSVYFSVRQYFKNYKSLSGIK